MIDVTSLSRYYGTTRAVDDVTFAIDDSSIVGLLGHNGAGKTTVMKMLSGFLEPSGGRISIGGMDMDSRRRDIQSQLGYLPENLPVYPEMTIADYLDYAASLKGLRGSHASAAIRRSVEATELGARLLDPIGTLSRGFKQRVGVAQAILGTPSLLILDEPGNGLDPEQNAHMRTLVRELARDATVILSTHIMQEVEALCDRVLVLVEGRLALDEDMGALSESRTLSLACSDDTQDMGKRLQQLPQVESVHRMTVGDGRAEFTLSLRDGADPDMAAGNIARTVIEGGARLFLLQPQRRDLEQIFREAVIAGETQETHHAA